MDQYASYGIKVNYLLFPRNGLTSPGYLKAISVWCSDDRADALTRAKAREEIEDKTCDNPIADHFNVGKKVGVTGTPAVLTQNGSLMPGYVPAKELAPTFKTRTRRTPFISFICSELRQPFWRSSMLFA